MTFDNPSLLGQEGVDFSAAPQRQIRRRRFRDADARLYLDLAGQMAQLLGSAAADPPNAVPLG